jgi:hypothetical protein
MLLLIVHYAQAVCPTTLPSFNRPGTAGQTTVTGAFCGYGWHTIEDRCYLIRPNMAYSYADALEECKFKTLLKNGYLPANRSLTLPKIIGPEHCIDQYGNPNLRLIEYMLNHSLSAVYVSLFYKLPTVLKRMVFLFF